MRHLFIFVVLISTSASSQIIPPRRQVPDAPKTAVVTGEVVRTDTGEPIAKANVFLSHDNADQPSDSTSRKVETDARGAFTFDRVQPGRYLVTARLPGYVGSRGGEASSATVALEAGDEQRTLLRLAPTPVVVGRVLDEDGIPLREAQVKILTRTSSGLRVLRTALTDERGEYRLYGFPAGRHIVCAAYRDRRRTSMRYPPSCYPETSNVDEAESIRFLPGQETPLNFALVPTNTITLQGVVSGVPAVAGKLVAAVHVKFEPKWQVVADDTHELTVQQPSGRFEIPSVLPGMYNVVATAVTAKETLSFRDTVEINESEDNTLALELTPAFDKPVQVYATIRFERNNMFQPRSVELEFRAIHSATHTEGSLPSPSRPRGVTASYLVKDKSGTRVTPEVEFETTIENGYTYLPVLLAKPPGSYLKSVRVPGRGDLPRTGFVANADLDLELVLANDAGSIEGDVFDSDGKPVADAIVVAASDLADPVRLATDQRGHFILSGIAPGSYHLYAFDSLGFVDKPDDDFLQPFLGLGQDVKAESNTGAETQLKLIHLIEDGQ